VLAYYKCEKIDECSCSTEKGEISLWELADRGKPRFTDITSWKTYHYKFSWNPCYPYSLSQSRGWCEDVAACFENAYSNMFYGIAKQSTAKCVLNENKECALSYLGRGARGRQTHLAVTLRCDESEKGRVDPMTVEPSLSEFKTVLRSKYACPRSSPTPSPTLPPPSPSTSTPTSTPGNSSGSSSGNSSGLSLGSKLLIAFFCILVVYIIGGILVNKYARHIEGKEAFPNYSFWTDLPSLIMDGCEFTFHSLGKLCGKGSRGKSYAMI